MVIGKSIHRNLSIRWRHYSNKLFNSFHIHHHPASNLGISVNDIGNAESVQHPSEPRPAYEFYLTEQYRLISGELARGSKDNRRVKAEGQERWKLMSQRQRFPYHLAHLIDRNRFRFELSSLGFPSRRPMNAYAQFSKEMIDSGQVCGGRRGFDSCMTRMHEIGRRWAVLSNTERLRYVEMARQDKLRYAQELSKASSAVRTALAIQKFRSRRDKSMKTTLRKSSADFSAKNGRFKSFTGMQRSRLRRLNNKPQYPVSPYFVFKAEFDEQQQQLLEASTHSSLSEYNRLVSRKWRELPAEQRTVYVDKFRRLQTDYQQQLTVWQSRMVAEGKGTLIRMCAHQKNERKLIRGN